MSGLTSAEASRIKFTPSGKGYNKREVVRTQRRVAGALLVMERNLGEEMPISAEEIKDATFSMNIGGFDYEEVDMFLDRAYRIVSAFEQTRPTQDAGLPIVLMTSEEAADRDFTVVFRGYNMASVDRYVARIADSIEAHETGRRSFSTDAAQASRKLFELSMRGYAEHQVDEFLDAAAETLRHYEDLRRRDSGSTQRMA